MTIDFSEDEWREHYFKHKILIVDDEQLKKGEVDGIASVNGFSFNFAKNPYEAWDKLTSNIGQYELMVVDNSMYTSNEDVIKYNEGLEKSLHIFGSGDPRNGNEGLQLIKRVRQHPELKDLEIIMYSGSGVREQAEALGAMYISFELYLLNEILREKSELYQKVVENPKNEVVKESVEKKKSIWDFLKRLS